MEEPCYFSEYSTAGRVVLIFSYRNRRLIHGTRVGVGGGELNREGEKRTSAGSAKIRGGE